MGRPFLLELLVVVLLLLLGIFFLFVPSAQTPAPIRPSAPSASTVENGAQSPFLFSDRQDIVTTLLPVAKPQYDCAPPQRPGISIQGLIVDQESVPVRDIPIRITSWPGAVDQTVLSDADGHFSALVVPHQVGEEVRIRLVPITTLDSTLIGHNEDIVFDGPMTIRPIVLLSERSCLVTGYLRYETGSPVTSGYVRLAGSQLLVLADPDGFFSISLPILNSSVQVRYGERNEGFIAEQEAILDLSPLAIRSGALDDVILVLPLANTVWKLRIVADTGLPVAGADVSTTNGARQVQTDRMGFCTIRTPSRGKMTVAIRKTGYCLRYVTLDTAELENEPLIICLYSLVAFSGLVRSAGGISIPSAKVRTALDPNLLFDVTETFADEVGRFALSVCLGNNPYYVVVTTADGRQGQGMFLPGVTQEPLVVTVRSHQERFGTVVSSAGLPIEAAFVRAVRDDRFEVASPYCYTGSDGTYRMLLAPNGRYHVSVSKAGFQSIEALVSWEDSFDFILPSAAIVSGTVSFSGPVPDAGFSIRLLAESGEGEGERYTVTGPLHFVHTNRFVLEAGTLSVNSRCWVEIQCAAIGTRLVDAVARSSALYDIAVEM